MRSRDAGTSPFVDYVEFCSSKKINHWNDLRPYFNDKSLKALRSLYDDVRDIDLLDGLLLETHSKNQIGQIGSCINADQFYRLRYGDRFFYSNPKNPNKFSAGMKFIAKLHKYFYIKYMKYKKYKKIFLIIFYFIIF